MLVETANMHYYTDLETLKYKFHDYRIEYKRVLEALWDLDGYCFEHIEK